MMELAMAKEGRIGGTMILSGSVVSDGMHDMRREELVEGRIDVI